jgi:hypothetical protein
MFQKVILRWLCFVAVWVSRSNSTASMHRHHQDLDTSWLWQQCTKQPTLCESAARQLLLMLVLLCLLLWLPAAAAAAAAVLTGRGRG